MNKPFIFLWLICVGCASTPDDNGDKFARNNSEGITIAAEVPGFVHSAARSRFHLGKNARQVSEFGLEKVVGDEGIIARNPVTGSVRAILNATSPANDVPALSNDEDVHNRTVVDYFIQAGLPAEQMGKAHVLANMRGDGPIDDETIADHPSKRRQLAVALSQPSALRHRDAPSATSTSRSVRGSNEPVARVQTLRSTRTQG